MGEGQIFKLLRRHLILKNREIFHKLHVTKQKTIFSDLRNYGCHQSTPGRIYKCSCVTWNCVYSTGLLLEALYKEVVLTFDSDDGGAGIKRQHF